MVEGNPGKRRLPAVEDIEYREGDLEPPKKLTKAQRVLWDRFVNTARWLTDHDTPKAYMWVCLQARYNAKPNDATAAMIGQIRALSSELGFDPGARIRIDAKSETAKPKTGAAKYLT